MVTANERVAVAGVKQALRQHGFSGWRVVGYQPMPHSINGPCATFIAESRTHTVKVVPMGGPGYGQWKVVIVNPASAAQPCYSPGYDPAKHEVTLSSYAGS